MEKEISEVSEQCRTLKQARLPFKVLDIKSTFLVSGQQRKRKHSDSEDSCKISKSSRSHDENIIVIDLYSPKKEENDQIENIPEIVSSPVKCYLLDKFLLKPTPNSCHQSVKPGEASGKSVKLASASHCSSICTPDSKLKKNASHTSGELISCSHSKKNNDKQKEIKINNIGVKSIECLEINSCEQHNLVSTNELCQNSKNSDQDRVSLEMVSSRVESCSDVDKMDTSGSSQILSLSDLDKVVSDESFKTEIAEHCQMGKKSVLTANCSFEGSSLSSLNCSTQSGESETPKANKSLQKDPVDKPRRKKKMSEAEAKQKSLLHEEKQKEKEAMKLKKLEEKDRLKRLKEETKQKLRQEKELEKLEAKNKKEQEKKERREQGERKKEEKLRQKQEKKELLEKERLEKVKEKEEKRQQKQQILTLKSEEKKKKEEDKLKKLEEKKKAEEDEERKRQKEKAAFASFFVKTDPPSPCEVDLGEGLFLPFQVTKDMTLAPIVPATSVARFSAGAMDPLVESQDCCVLYLEMLKTGHYVPYRRQKQAGISEDNKNDIIIVDCSAEKELSKKLHPKLLQFCENVRPPYWGTWRKRSKIICSRKPFACDQIFFDYDVDSDEEWDEGGPGESLSATEDEKESEDDYEVDNEFFVPHGYLSSDEEDDDEGNLSHSPESQRERLKMRAREFEAERNQKCSQLQPIIMGGVWHTVPSGQDEHRTMLMDYSAVLIAAAPIMTSYTLPEIKASEGHCGSPSPNCASDGSVQRQQGGSKRPVPEEAMPFLIELVHCNTSGRHAVVREFQEFWRQYCLKQLEENSAVKNSLPGDSSPKVPTGVVEQTSEPRTPKENGLISKRQLELTLQKISVWGKCPSPALTKNCWWVHEEVREKYGCTSLPIPNKYVSRKEPENISSSTPVMGTPSIKKFVKKIVPIRLSGSTKAQCALPFSDQDKQKGSEKIIINPDNPSKSE